MIWIFVTIIIIIISIFISHTNMENIGGYIGNGFIALIISCLVFLVGHIIAAEIIVCSDPEQVKYETINTTEIIALKDNFNGSGSWFLGSGHYDNDLYYFYMTETDKGLKPDKIKVSDCYIKYDNDIPRIVTTEGIVKDKWWVPWGCIVRSETIIYVPYGSISTQILVDLE